MFFHAFLFVDSCGFYFLLFTNNDTRRDTLPFLSHQDGLVSLLVLRGGVVHEPVGIIRDGVHVREEGAGVVRVEDLRLPVPSVLFQDLVRVP